MIAEDALQFVVRRSDVLHLVARWKMDDLRLDAITPGTLVRDNP